MRVFGTRKWPIGTIEKINLRAATQPFKKFLRNEGSAFALQTARPCLGGPREMATPSWVVDVKIVSSISTFALNTLTLKLSAFFVGTFGLSFWKFGRQRNIPVVMLKPLNPTIEQHQFSPNISRSSRVQVMRNTKLITKGEMFCSYIKFPQLILQGNVWILVWRICIWIMGIKELVLSPPYSRRRILL